MKHITRNFIMWKREKLWKSNWKRRLKMYLHIGKNYMIQEKDIICLLNIDSLPPQVYQQLKEQYQNCLIDLSSENPRAFIITKKKEK